MIDSQAQEDIERRKRLHEWFKSEPSAWKDISEELNIELKNESLHLKNRVSTHRDWSSGYVSAIERILDYERYFRKWNHQS